MVKEIIAKVFRNRRNNQLSVALSKRKIRALHPDIKFGKELFVKMRIFVRKKK